MARERVERAEVESPPVVPPACWERVCALFDEVTSAAPAEWERLASEAADGEAEVRNELLRLLRAAKADRFHLERPSLSVGEPDHDEPADRIGSVIARYRLVRLVGRGGMGSVYEGIRADDAYQQRVAVKLIRPHIVAPGIAMRFRRERQILAALEHRNISRLLDGGTTEDGEPFFVMEYVEGAPITTYCDALRSSIHDRLRLFLQVCAAVQHAHGKLIVHRDLKPANIFVTPDGSVKLLDFGVAKLLDAHDDAAADINTATQLGRPLTPEYASPEQLRDEPASAASDVYSLGVVLHELLTGMRPFTMRVRSPAVALRALENDPPRPSSVVTGDSAQRAGEHSVARMKKKLAGELDNIVRKALRTDLTRRYASVEQLAEDVRRYLAGMPVLAQPDTAVYRIRKFSRRHQVGVTAAVITSLALLGGFTAATLQVRRVAAERAKENRVNAFLQGILSAPDARWYAAGRGTRALMTMSDVLDDAAVRADTALAADPAVESSVRKTLGQTFLALSRYDQATRQLARALELDRKMGAAPVPDIATDLRDLGLVQLGGGSYRRADSVFRAALDLCRNNDQRSDTAYVCGHVINDLGVSLGLERDFDGSLRLLNRALAIARQGFGEWHPAVGVVLSEIADVHYAMGDLQGSERLYREALAVFRHSHRDFPERAATLGGLALALETEHRFAEAEPLLLEEDTVIAVTEGANHLDRGVNLIHLANVHREMKLLPQARREMGMANTMLENRLSARILFYTKARIFQAQLLLASGSPRDADKLLVSTLREAGMMYERDDPRLAEVQDALGQVLIVLGRPKEAMELLTTSHATFLSKFGASHPQTIDSEQHLDAARHA